MSYSKVQEAINLLTKRQNIIKRVFDFVLSVILIVFCIIPIVFLIILSTIDTKMCGLFCQKRVGKNAINFTIYKVRTINKDGSISFFCRFLRKSKLDELPQLFNILFGKMSFVGPRPDVQGFANLLKKDNRIILSIKPGLTSPATINFINEEELLRRALNKEKLIATIWSEKVKMNKEYVMNYNIFKDFYYIFKTIVKIIENLTFRF